MKVIGLLYECWEIIIFISLLIISALIYSIATRNRGSFVDTPDWSKVIRRIVEMSMVLLCSIIIAFFAWCYDWLYGIKIILFAIGGIISVLTICIITNRIINKKFSRNGTNENKENIDKQQFKTNLAEHLINALILTVFFLIGFIIILVTILKLLGNMELYYNFVLLLEFFLSIQFSLLLYQLYYLVIINKIPSEEIIQITRICQDLNK